MTTTTTLISQKTYTFDNLSIVKTVMADNRSRHTLLTIERNEGEYWLTLTPQDPDYAKAIKLMLNKENGFVD